MAELQLLPDDTALPSDSHFVDEAAITRWINKRQSGASSDSAAPMPTRSNDVTTVPLTEDPDKLLPLDGPTVLFRKGWKVDQPPRVRQVILQEFEGRVVSISRHSGVFTAYLTDVTTGSHEESEDVDLLIDDISDADLPLFEEGAIFRWLIGYRYEGTTKERFSRLFFRRIPALSKQQREAFWKKAEESGKSLRWE